VAVGLVNGLLGRSIAHFATVTAAGDGFAFHANGRTERSGRPTASESPTDTARPRSLQ
jgi:hypothetical protein